MDDSLIAGTGVQPIDRKQESYLTDIVKSVHSGEAKLYKVDNGKYELQYEDNRHHLPKLPYLDPSKAMTILTPQTEEHYLDNVRGFIDVIDFIKSNKAPKGVVRVNSRVMTSRRGDYRESIEYTDLKEILSKGNLHGDITVVRDKATNTTHAVKTVMISMFRKEELLAWVDLDGEGICPELYAFILEDNEVHFHMEKLDKAITLRDIIDERMSTLRDEAPELVKPFSLYLLHNLLSVVDVMHTNNWNHRDLHAGNLMLQETEEQMSLKVLDFGMANLRHDELRPEPFDLRGEQDDIHQIVRLFIGIYLDCEFESASDLKENYKRNIDMHSQIHKLSLEDRKEVMQLAEAVMMVATGHKEMGATITDVGKRISSGDKHNGWMKRAIEYLFRHEDLDENLETGGDDDIDSSMSLREALHLWQFQIG